MPLAKIRATVVSSPSGRGASSSVVATIEGLTMQGQRAQHYDIAAVGGGLVGSAIAWGLVGIGQTVAVLDEGDVAYRAARGKFALVRVQSKGLGMPRYASWTKRSSDGVKQASSSGSCEDRTSELARRQQVIFVPDLHSALRKSGSQLMRGPSVTASFGQARRQVQEAGPSSSSIFRTPSGHKYARLGWGGGQFI